MTNNMCKSMVYYFNETENFIGNFDIIHGHDWHVVLALDELKKVKGKRLFLLFIRLNMEEMVIIFHDGKARDISNIEWYGTYIADRVIVCSNAMKEEVMRLYKVPEWKIRVIPNGIWADRFDGK